MRWDVAIIIFIILSFLIWGPMTFVPMTIGQKGLATVAALLTSVFVTMLHPALRDD